MERFGDLHTHTAHSRQGNNFLAQRLKSFSEARKGMPGFELAAITDHDTLNGLEPMYRVIREVRSSLPLILPGIEITSASDQPESDRRIETHLLGYFPQLIERDDDVILSVKEALEPLMLKVILGKLKKNTDIRIGYFVKNGIIPSQYDSEEIRVKVLKKIEEDQAFVNSMESKEGDIINWPVNTSWKMLIEVLAEEGILVSKAEGRLYIDRKNDAAVAKLAKIYQKNKGLSEEDALEKAQELQGSCSDNPDDDYYTATTEESILAVRQAGGIPVLAHPMNSLKKFNGDLQSFLEFLKKKYLPVGLQGLEAFYPGQQAYTPAFVEFCKQNGLYITGGSDDHQFNNRAITGHPDGRCPIEYILKIPGVREGLGKLL